MAIRVVVELIDDLDGGKADVTVVFALEGQSYEIDVSEQNADKMRKDLNEYVGAARRLHDNATANSGRRRA